MLNESQWRIPSARGKWIKLADGQKWMLREPVLEFRAVVDESGVATFEKKAAVDPLIDRYVAATEAIDEAEALLNVALSLLEPNYDLTRRELVTLLPWRKDEDNQAMWQEIANLALGVAPKPTPVGSEPPSLPTGSPG